MMTCFVAVVGDGGGLSSGNSWRPPTASPRSVCVIAVGSGAESCPDLYARLQNECFFTPQSGKTPAVRIERIEAWCPHSQHPQQEHTLTLLVACTGPVRSPKTGDIAQSTGILQT